MESDWRDSNSEETGVRMWAVDFKIMDSRGKQSGNTALGPSGKGTTPRAEVLISKSSSPWSCSSDSRQSCVGLGHTHAAYVHSHTDRWTGPGTRMLCTLTGRCTLAQVHTYCALADVLWTSSGTHILCTLTHWMLTDFSPAAEHSMLQSGEMEQQ